MWKLQSAKNYMPSNWLARILTFQSMWAYCEHTNSLLKFPGQHTTAAQLHTPSYSTDTVLLDTWKLSSANSFQADRSESKLESSNWAVESASFKSLFCAASLRPFHVLYIQQRAAVYQHPYLPSLTFSNNVNKIQELRQLTFIYCSFSSNLFRSVHVLSSRHSVRGHDPPSGQAPLRVLRAPDLKESGSLKVRQVASTKRIVKMHEFITCFKSCKWIAVEWNFKKIYLRGINLWIRLWLYV